MISGEVGIVHMFFGNLVILVNGCSTQEISIQMDLNQGDPLALFLFLLVVEGLSVLFSRAIDQHLFTGLRVGSLELVVFHLQYADDMIIIAYAFFENIWPIKVTH